MGEKEGGTEIHAKLVLDEEAKEAAERLREGFEGIKEKVHETQHELMEMAKQAVAVGVGFEMFRGIESIKELGHEVLDAAEQSDQAEKNIAGLLAVSDKTGKSFEELQTEAKGVHEELETIGIKAGASGEVLGEAFEMIASRSKKSAHEILELTDKMATAGRILPGGIGQIANAWRDMEQGIIRPRNALVQLMVQSHVVDGTMKQTARYLTQMMQTPGGSEKAFELAEMAITRMAAKAKDAPMSYGQLIQSLKNIRELVFKDAGEPIIAGLKGPVQELRDYLIENKQAIEEWSHAAGVKVGVWVKEAAHEIKEGFQYLQNHAQEIEDAIKGGFHMAKEVVEFILAHKEELALAFGASKVAGIAGSVGQGIGALGALGEGASTAGIIGVAGVAGGMAGIALAKAWETNVTEPTIAQTQQVYAALEEASKQGQVERAHELRDEVVLLDSSYASLANHLAETAARNKQMIASNDEYEKGLLDAFDSQAGRKEKKDQAWAVQQYMAEFNDAVDRGDQATQAQMAAYIVTHQNLLDAMHTSGVDITKGGEQLANVISNLTRVVFANAVTFTNEGGTLHGMGGETSSNKNMIAEEIRGMLKSTKAALSSPVMDFSGSTFHIHQDFRDVDPDRVIAVMRKDLVHSAAARTQSRSALPFGM